MKTKTDAQIQELIEAAENAVYWMLCKHAADAEEGKCEIQSKPAFLLRLQAAVKPLSA